LVLVPNVLPLKLINRAKTRNEKKEHSQVTKEAAARSPPGSLPVETIVYEVPELYCTICGRPYYKTPLFETSTDIHIEIRYVRRVHKRTIYKSTCTCHIPRLITAPAPPKLIPKGKFSTSFWAKVLYDRFVLQTPWYRQLQAMKDYQLDVSRGVITGGLKNIFPYLVPFYELLEQTIKTEKYRHSDETSWMMIEERRQRWWLWAQSSSKIIFFCLDPSRSHRVPARLMENNKVERELRGPVLGRKNSPVIRSSWAGLLIAIMYSVTETCKLHKVNPYLWLENTWRPVPAIRVPRLILRTSSHGMSKNMIILQKVRVNLKL
jgi:hypothetical protein